MEHNKEVYEDNYGKLDDTGKTTKYNNCIKNETSRKRGRGNKIETNWKSKH